VCAVNGILPQDKSRLASACGVQRRRRRRRRRRRDALQLTAPAAYSTSRMTPTGMALEGR
jgi:hypothetical protein